MEKTEDQRLADAGFKETTVAEFLGLSPEEEAIVETSLILSRLVREKRQQLGWTQVQLAAHLNTKQPQVVRLETGEGVSFDAQFAALYAMGVTPREIGERLAGVSLKIGAKILEEREAATS